MTTEAAPPPQPPQLSPDHKWVWDGTQWRPLAVHEAIFPSWSSVGAGVPAEMAAQQAAPARAVMTPPPMPSPVPVYQVPVYQAPPTQPDAEPPIWVERPRPGGINNALYAVAGLIALIVIGALLANFLPSSLPWQQSESRPTASPTAPITDWSEHGRADRLVNTVLPTPMGDLTRALTGESQACGGPLTSACEDALVNADSQAESVLAILDHESVPHCLTAGTGQIHVDLQNIHTSVQLVFKGSKDGRADEVSAGIAQVANVRGQLQGDWARLNNTVKSPSCNPAPTEPPI